MTHADPSPARAGRKLLFTLAALLLLTGLSWGLTRVPTGFLGPWLSLGIAAVKALLVIAFFMEVAERGPTVRTIALTTVAFIALLCLGIAGDVLLR